MNYKLLPVVFLLFCTVMMSHAQNDLQVETILDLNASGGVTFGPDGNVYVSDFGPSLGAASSNTKVYQVEYGTWNVTEFATGFAGASGARFDSQGNFYQSNPSGARVSKRTPDGTVNYNWATAGLSVPIGITNDAAENLYVCNCGNNTVSKITPGGLATTFATSPLFNCPNGITIDPDENLFVCNFSDGRILKVTPDGTVSLLKTFPTISSGVGNGHLTYSNGYLFVATIGVGQIYKLSLTGEDELIAGVANGFSNTDGPALQATFSKPNGIAASITGDTMWVNCSTPTWASNANALHPGKVRMITGVCSLPDVDCPLLTTSTTDLSNNINNKIAELYTLAPNPVNDFGVIRYVINKPIQNIRLKIVDAMSQSIVMLADAEKTKGEYQMELDTRDWVAGVYFVSLEADGFVTTQKFIVAK